MLLYAAGLDRTPAGIVAFFPDLMIGADTDKIGLVFCHMSGGSGGGFARGKDKFGTVERAVRAECNLISAAAGFGPGDRETLVMTGSQRLERGGGPGLFGHTIGVSGGIQSAIAKRIALCWRESLEGFHILQAETTGFGDRHCCEISSVDGGQMPVVTGERITVTCSSILNCRTRIGNHRDFFGYR